MDIQSQHPTGQRKKENTTNIPKRDFKIQHFIISLKYEHTLFIEKIHKNQQSFTMQGGEEGRLPPLENKSAQREWAQWTCSQAKGQISIFVNHPEWISWAHETTVLHASCYDNNPPGSWDKGLISSCLTQSSHPKMIPSRLQCKSQMSQHLKLIALSGRCNTNFAVFLKWCQNFLQTLLSCLAHRDEERKKIPIYFFI